MKIKPLTLINVILATVLLSSIVFSRVTTTSSVDYDPWLDVNDDGFGGIDDIVAVAEHFGAEGNPVTKAALTYDSGWLNITDKAGQYITITHNLNSTDIIVDVTGKTTIDSGVHQRNLGGTGYTQGWSRTYGGTDGEVTYCLIQTVDGGYALAGLTDSYGLAYYDFWLVRTDADENMQWNQTYGETGLFDVAHSLVQTSDGGYAMAGWTGFPFNSEFWLVRTDADGNMLWNQTYGRVSPFLNEAYSLVEASDGGYAMAGTTLTETGHDSLLVKTEVWEHGLVWTDSTADTITLYRGATDAYWNYVCVRIWKIKE